jgi:hypothetical protein
MLSGDWRNGVYHSIDVLFRFNNARPGDQNQTRPIAKRFKTRHFRRIR